MNKIVLVGIIIVSFAAAVAPIRSDLPEKIIADSIQPDRSLLFLPLPFLPCSITSSAFLLFAFHVPAESCGIDEITMYGANRISIEAIDNGYIVVHGDAGDECHIYREALL